MTPQARLDVHRANEVIARAGALIFDVDGTLAETEEVHRQAFNEAFAATGIDWCWDCAIYKQLLQVTGGKERIRAFDRMRGGGPSLSDLWRWSVRSPAPTLAPEPVTTVPAARPPLSVISGGAAPERSVVQKSAAAALSRQRLEDQFRQTYHAQACHVRNDAATTKLGGLNVPT